MIYVVDTGVLRELFAHIKRSVFPEIWEALEKMIDDGQVQFVKESYKEMTLQFSKDGNVIAWLNKYKGTFHTASSTEADIVSQIYAVKHFQNNISEKAIREGRPVADAFIVARAKMLSATVVTREKNTPNAARIPNICDHFDVLHTGEEVFQKMLKDLAK